MCDLLCGPSWVWTGSAFSLLPGKMFPYLPRGGSIEPSRFSSCVKCTNVQSNAGVGGCVCLNVGFQVFFASLAFSRPFVLFSFFRSSHIEGGGRDGFSLGFRDPHGH